MSPWLHLRHARTVRRLHEWQRLLGQHYARWASLLQTVVAPMGIRFIADFGTGEVEFELTRDDNGFVAIPVEGVTPHRLNTTEAEFACIDVVSVLQRVARAAALEGPIEAIESGGPYALGTRVVSGRSIAVFAFPRDTATLKPNERRRLAPRTPAADVGVLLLPDAGSLTATARDEFAGLRIGVSELPHADPWTIDWSPLADERFDIPRADPVFFYGTKHAVIVDLEQQRIWLEGRELKVKADGHSYRLLSHLAENAGMVVPTKMLANNVLESESDRSEAKIVSEAKSELMKAIKTCLTPAPAPSRLDAASLVVIEDGRARLNVDAALVKVIRRLSDR